MQSKSFDWKKVTPFYASTKRFSVEEVADKPEI